MAAPFDDKTPRDGARDETDRFLWVGTASMRIFAEGEDPNNPQEPQVVAALDPLRDNDKVITGVGGRITDHEIAMLELEYRPINADGTLGDRATKKFGNTSNTSESFVHVEDNQVVVGVGLRGDGSTLNEVRVYYRTWDAAMGTVTGDLGHHDSSTKHGPQMDWFVNPDDYVGLSSSATILTGFGAIATENGHGDAQITMLGCSTGQISYFFDPSELPEAAQKAIEKRDHTLYDPDDIPLYMALAPFADDAYLSVYGDDQFANPVRNLDQSYSSYGSRQGWLSETGYLVIENPDGTDSQQQNWGILCDSFEDPVSGEKAAVVAFRGTMNWELLFVDLDGTGLGADPSIAAIMSGRAAFWADKWTVGTQSNMVVHRGFLKVYKSVADSVRSQLYDILEDNDEIERLYLVGHSLGAGLASLCAVDLKFNPPAGFDLPMHLVNFASPRVGDSRFVGALGQSVVESHQVYHQYDIVPYVPVWWDTSDLKPVIQASGLFYDNPGQARLNVDKFFPSAHFLPTYYQTLRTLQPTDPDGQLQPTDEITSLALKITTGSTIGAGTDADVYCAILGKGWGPLDHSGNDFERGDVDTYDLYATFPNKKPDPPAQVQDLYDTYLSFWLENIGWSDIYTYPWELGKVEVIVNNVVFITFDESSGHTWVGPGSPPLHLSIGRP